MSLRDLAKPAVVTKSIEYKGKQETVYVQELSVKDANQLFECFNKQKTLEARKILINKSIVDEDGKPLFTQAEVENLPVELASKLESAAMIVNGFSEDGTIDAKKD